jgi:hypothetical protein
LGQNDQIGLRDQRKPGYCWQENELYDAFLPIIGAMPAHVYAQATRYCYKTTARFSLREMADSSGISKDTVRRSLLVMQEIGMLRARDGAPGKAAEYELVDLKDLAAHLGAQYDRKRASYIFPAAIAAALRNKVQAVLGKSQGKTVSVRDSSSRVRGSATVSQRDSLFVENGCESVSRRDATVSPGVETVSPQGQPYISNTQDIKTTSPLPLPASGKGMSPEVSPALRLANAAHSVCVECGIADARLEKAIVKAISLYGERERMSPAEVAAAMIGAWREYDEVRDAMRYPWAVRKFLLHGHWATPLSWRLDRWERSQSPDARVGMNSS